jgi:hypothetical protein
MIDKNVSASSTRQMNDFIAAVRQAREGIGRAAVLAPSVHMMAFFSAIHVTIDSCMNESNRLSMQHQRELDNLN